MSTGVFPLGRLPPELRNLIYGFVFVVNSPIRIIRGCPSGSKKFALKATIEIPRKRSAAVTTKTVPFLPKNGLSILRLNKALHSEAYPMLYAINTFFFANIKSLQQFSKEAARGLTHIERIRVTKPGIIQAWDTLVKQGAASRLQYLELAISTHCYASTWEAFGLYDGVKTFIESAGDPEAARQRFDTITFASYAKGTPDSFRCRAERRAEPAAKTQAPQRVKKVLEKMLVYNGVLKKMGARPA